MAKYNIKSKFSAGYELPKIGELTKKQYLEEFIELNKTNILSSYRREQKKFETLDRSFPGSSARFTAQYPDLTTYVKRLVGKNISKKRLQEVITTRLGYFEESHKQHLADLITNSEFIDELQLRINEKFNVDRLTYEGAGVYHYITETGNTVKFRFTDYSPAVLEFFE